MDNIRGAVLMVLAMLAFALEDMFIKLMSADIPIGQILLMLGIGGTLAFGGIVRTQGDALFVAEMKSVPIALRAFGEVVGTMCFVSAIALTPLSSASAILQATPLVVTLGAALFLGENVGWRRWSAVMVGLFGVLLILRPGMESFEILSLLAVGAVFCLATRDLATRKVAGSITTMQLSFLGFLAVVPGGVLITLMSDRVLVWPSQIAWFYFAGALGIGLIAYYAVVAAMRLGDVSFVTPFRYSRLLFALVIGVGIFGEAPDAMTLIGAAIIVASGIYTVWRERRLGLTT